VTQDTKETQIEQIPGDGGAVKPDEQMLKELKDEIATIHQQTGKGVWSRRDIGEETRFCVWTGQALDGRKHKEQMQGEEPFPFEGASDGRIRMADEIINEKVAILLSATNRAEVKAVPVESLDAPRTGKIQTLMRYIRKNVWRRSYRREIEKLANFQQADSPGAAVLACYWRREYALKIQTLTLEQIAVGLVQVYGGQVSADQVQILADMITDPTREQEMVEWFQGFLPSLTASRARDMVKQLRETGTAEFPMPYIKIDQPEIRALRIFEDIYFNMTCSDFQNARYIFWRELLTEAQLREREVGQGWSKAFIDKVLEHKGETAFQVERTREVNVQGDYSAGADDQRILMHEDHYEVIRAFTRRTNDDGIPGIYSTEFHFQVDITAKDMELLDYKHGDYPFVFFPRERVSNAVLDTRGIPELVVSDQNTMKLLNDSRNDHTQLSTIPPVLVPPRTRTKVLLGPLSEIVQRRPGEVAFMPPPAYPQSNDVHQRQTQKRVDTYFGRMTENVPEGLGQILSEKEVGNFLDCLSDAFSMTLQLCQQYMDDKRVQRIVGGKGLELPRSQEEIQGAFDVQLSFDTRDFNIAYVETVGNIVAQLIAPMDRKSTIMYDKVVQRLMYALDPNLAEETLQPVQAASMQEIEDEQANYAMIFSGQEPEMAQGGQDYQLRLQVLEEIIKKNPESPQAMAPNAQEILRRRLQHLQFMVQQMQNADIGRVGAQPALGGQPQGGAAPATGAQGPARKSPRLDQARQPRDGGKQNDGSY